MAIALSGFQINFSRFLVGLTAALSLLGGCGEVDNAINDIETADIKAILKKERGEAPGLAGGVITDKKIVVAADGVRTVGAATALGPDDWLALSSNSKSMTAMAVAVQVEKGVLKWSDSLSTIFPEIKDVITRPAKPFTGTARCRALRAGELQTNLKSILQAN
jgi:CubicO group peptidase (beta-lactamase class C family)